jgi:hypothetical protein
MVASRSVVYEAVGRNWVADVVPATAALIIVGLLTVQR